MKHLLVIIGVVILCLSLAACDNRSSYGQTDHVVTDIGQSEEFSADEINEAMDRVLEKFKDFNGCDLTELWYDEAHSDAWTKDYAAGTAIVLLSEFDVDATGGGSFNPNSTYPSFSWILTRENADVRWQVEDWGY